MISFSKKHRLLMFALSIISLQLFPQNYTWKKGSNVINQNGFYGNSGIFAPANHPGGRESAVSWKDIAGNFWLFGGFGKDASNFNQLSDLWKYIPAVNQWAFMKGDSIGGQPGVYGLQGLAAAANKPGSRSQAVSWVDGNGNFWLFGGNGFDAGTQQGFLNDLWKYSPTTNQWTWMKGSNAISQGGTYGSQGVGSGGNTPGAREGAVAWTDASGNLWLFGGFGLEATSNLGQLNDLWKYNPVTNQWTWMKGSNSYDQNGTYGTLSSPAVANTPGGRRYASAWTDGTGNLWLLGGYGYPASGPLTGHLNDLWKYNPTINQWVWIKGSNSVDQLGIYGTQGVSAVTNVPGSRVGGISWADASGNLWLMGGAGMGYLIQTVDYLNDLWRYNPTTNQWTWVKGGNSISQAGVYGTQGVPAPNTTPGGRTFGLGWMDNNSNFLWLFGGSGYDTNSQSSSGYLNDLWKFGSCVTETLSVSSTPSAICSGSSATLTASGAGSYQWNTQQTNASIYVSPASSTVYVVHSSSPNGCGDSAVFALNVFSLPLITVSSSNSLACLGSTITLSASGALTYTWNIINQTGASIQIMAAASGVSVFTVTGTNANACVNTATLSQVVSPCEGIGENDTKPLSFSVFPNPCHGNFNLKNIGVEENMTLSFVNSTGQVVLTLNAIKNNEMIISTLPKGIYYLRLNGQNTSYTTFKLIVE